MEATIPDAELSSAKLRKMERNRRRRRTIRKKEKKKLREVFVKSKELEKELAHTKNRLEQTKMRALELSKEIFKTPIAKRRSASSVRFSLRSKPTASSVDCTAK